MLKQNNTVADRQIKRLQKTVEKLQAQLQAYKIKNSINDASQIHKGKKTGKTYEQFLNSL